MPKKVLIIEDNKTNMDALCKIIMDLKQDIRLFCADDLKKALEISLEHHIHLFLVDIILNTQKPGDVSGLEFVREIREISKYKFTPIIFITSLEDPKLYSYSQLRCFSYIEKPFSVAQVRDTVLNAFEFPVVDDDERCVYFRKDGIVYSKCIKEIVSIECRRRKIKICCINDELEIPYKTCEEVLRELDSDSFLQCSRYHIINRKYVDFVDYPNRFVKMKYINTPIEIGVTMKKEFKRRMENG